MTTATSLHRIRHGGVSGVDRRDEDPGAPVARHTLAQLSLAIHSCGDAR